MLKANTKRKPNIDMTQGNIVSLLIRFAIPLLVGNLFQQLYNLVDTWVVGNYVSNEAFTAVGNVGSICNVLISALTGLASGVSVIVSQYYGARQYNKVEEVVHTAAILSLILGVIFTAVGLVTIPAMLKLIKMHDSAVGHATIYLVIYFLGISFSIIYNICAGILRAIGDSKRPLYFLVVSTLTNVTLDLLFVIGFGMGVAGVAIATVFSNLLSAVLIIITLLKTDTCIKLDIKKIRIHKAHLKKIFALGLPSALQMSITALSNVFAISYISQFDLGSPSPDYMSGWTAHSKIDALLYLPTQSIGLAATTFVGQNLGKNQLDRLKKGVTCSVWLSLLSTGLLLIPVFIFAPVLVRVLNGRAEVIAYGSMFVRYISPFYLTCCLYNVYAGALRGSGNTMAPTIIMLGTTVLFRQFLLSIISSVSDNVILVAMSYPAGWILSAILMVLFYYKTNLTRTRIAEPPATKDI